MFCTTRAVIKIWRKNVAGEKLQKVSDCFLLTPSNSEEADSVVVTQNTCSLLSGATDSFSCTEDWYTMYFKTNMSYEPSLMASAPTCLL